MTRFIIRRAIYAIITLFILSLTIFTVVRLTGDPVTLLAEPGARAEDLDRIRIEWGLEWLPTSGQGGWRNLIMPAVALGWYFAASLLRLTRSSMLEVLRSEYIKLARLKGLPGYVVIAMHAFKNALIPVLTLAGINLVVMLNAAVIIEVIF